MTMSPPLFDSEFLKRLDYLNLIARRLVFGRQQALRPSVRKGASIEFRDYRNYVAGDDPRTIDWAAYARLDELVVKLFRQEEELDLWVLVDCSGSMDFGSPNKFDAVRRIAAALAYIGMNNMDSASVLRFAAALGGGCPRLRGRGRIFGLLDALTGWQAADTTDLPRVAREFVSRARRPGLVILLSDFYGLTAAQRALDQLRFFKHEIYVIQVASPWELDPPLHGELRLVDTESEELSDLLVTPSLLRRYRREFDEFHEQLRRYCMRYSIGYARLSTEVPFDEFILGILQRGGLVA
jgi:uncharacterized protein (DUF58 family)